jgi:hypothetical protein
MRSWTSFLAVTLVVCGIARADTTFTYTGIVQTFTTPEDGEYQITVYGAQGGSGNSNSGGYGAEIQAFFNLTLDESLSVYVGGLGGNTSGYGGGGGGGGSFVVTSGGDPLIVAGGGGAGGGESGVNGNPGQTGETSDLGGGGGGFDGAAGGAGFNGDGANAGSGNGGSTPQGGSDYANGFGGGSGGDEGGGGGYGGGGGGGYDAGGGGGGYSGGGGANQGNPGIGGGGGSYVDLSAVFESIAIAGENSGNGEVVISYVGPEGSVTPEPGSFVLGGLGLIGIVAARRRRRSA